MNIILNFHKIENDIVKSLSKKPKKPIKDVERVIKEKIYDEMNKQINESIENNIDFSVLTHDCYNNKNLSINMLIEDGLKIHNIDIITKWKKPTIIEEIEFEVIGAEFKYYNYGYGVRKNQHFYKKELKTQVNLKTRLSTLFLPSIIFKNVINIYNKNKIEDYLIWDEKYISEDKRRLLPIYYNAINGGANICACSKEVFKKAGGIPDGAKIRENICHLCIAKNDGIKILQSKYGTNYIFYKKPFIDYMELFAEIDSQTARAEIDRLLKTSKWKNEGLLYSIIKENFSDYTIIREYSPSWLSPLRIDIFIKEINLAIEYQGKQHFVPVNVFGGEEAFLKGQKRDKQKFELCKENKVNVIYFTYKDNISLNLVQRKLKKYID